MKGNIIDISLPLHSKLPFWPGSPGFKLVHSTRLEDGAPSNNSKIESDVHAGTHIDAPLHFIRNGRSIDQLPLELLIGPAFLAHLPDVDSITDKVLEEIPLDRGTKRLLLRTKNSNLWKNSVQKFNSEYVAITPEAARWIVNHEIQVVGIDYLSIQLYHDKTSATHEILLENNIIVVEGLNLECVEQGVYEFICLPINIQGAEGAPARAILRTR